MNRAPPRLDVNILPGEYRRRRLELNQILLLVALVIVIVLTFLFYRQVSAAVLQTSYLQSELAALNEQVEVRRTRVAERTETVGLTLQYEDIIAKRGVLTEDVQAIADAADEVGIQLSSILHEGDSVVASCQAVGHSKFEEYRKAFDDYCEALVQTGRFASADYSALSFPPTASVDVEITVTADSE